MERTRGTRKASKLVTKDFISNMPDDVVTNILNRLPLQDAVRTCVLSRNWRFKWNMLSQVVCNESFYEYLIHTGRYKNYERIISIILLNLTGAITKFYLYMFDCLDNDEDIAHWILFLSRKVVKDFTICKWNGEALEVPTNIFSCLELTRLKLFNCRFDPPASFHGFPNLLRLELVLAEFENGKFGELFTQCPVLEILNLGYTDFEGQLNLSEITKLTNLKKLSLSLNNLDNMVITSTSSIFELLGSLPKLQELKLGFEDFKFTEDGASKRSPTTFPCLVDLELSYINLSSSVMLSLAFEIIRSSSNLQTFKITTHEWYDEPPDAVCSDEADYNLKELLHLQRVVFKEWTASKNEVCLLKCLLACSPFLEKIDIHLNTPLSREKSRLTRKLLKTQLASRVAEIILP